MFAERLICALGLASGAFCQTYVTFSVGAATFPNSINDKGEITGSYGDIIPNHGFVRDPGGTITTFDVPGSSNTQAFSINDEGAITGIYTVPSGGQHAYVRDPEGNFTTFDPPGSISTMAQSINAGGAVTGYYHESNNVDHGFVRRADGKLISFDPPGSIQTHALSINAKGAITGSYLDANNRSHGFVRPPGGEIVSFDVPESTGTIASSINDVGAIAGSYRTANFLAFGFVRDPHGKFTSFNDLPGDSVGVAPQVRNINNEGVITGDAAFPRNASFVRSPDGTITFPFPPGVCFRQVPPTSINDEGVITSSCLSILLGQVGWVRFP